MTNQNSEIGPDSNLLKITRRRWRPRFIFLYLAFILLGFVALLVLGESLIRLAVPERYWRYYVAQDNWLPDPVLGWRNKPNLNFMHFETEMLAFRTNEDGLQVAQSLPGKSGAVVRVMLFGDSTVVGSAVMEDARLHHQLARRLATRGIRAEVINAGVEGYSTDQSLLAMESLVPRYRPQVVIHMVCANDFHGNVSAVNYGLPKPRFTMSNQGRLDLAVPNIDASPLAHDTPAFFSRATLQKSALYRMLRPALSRFRARIDRQTTRNLAQGDDMSPSPDLLSKVDWALFDNIVIRMRAVCIASDTEFLLTQHPSIGEVENIAQLNSPLEARLMESAKSCSVLFCPVISKLQQAHHKRSFHLLPRDPHCNGLGYEQIAACLDEAVAARTLKRNPSSDDRSIK